MFILIMLDQYLLECIMAILRFIFKHTSEWAKKAKPYILQAEYSHHLFIYKNDGIIVLVNTYLKKRSHCFSKIVQRMQYIRRA